VKVKQQKHVHTLIKPVHVHHKPTIIKEEVKPIIKEIHKHPVEIHKEIHKEIEYKKPTPIYKEEISHEHLHHHYKHVHPDITSHGTSYDFGSSNLDGSYSFANTHP
jgi:hypothetical protein